MVDMKEVLSIHEAHTGVLDIESQFDIKTPSALSEAYTPGVAGLAKLIANDESKKNIYTMSGKLIPVITDGSAVLGLGNIGPAAGLPIVEGKALIYKNFANVNALPMALNQVSVDEFVNAIKAMAPSFAGIHLEDIGAPRVFEIERRLSEELDIPVYHDDQTGTAIVVLAGLINAAKVVGKNLQQLKVLVNGIGAAGVATTKILLAVGLKNITLVDIDGVVRSDNQKYNSYQRELTTQVNQSVGATLDEVIVNQDVFVGLSDANVLTDSQVRRMAKKPIIFALANPVPEISPEEAINAGAAVVATGSSQWPNQVNNVLVFPGLFKGLLSSGLKHVDMPLQIRVAHALADMIENPDATHVVPGVFGKGNVHAVEQSILDYAKQLSGN
ncbi:MULTISPECIES: NADP-dependent malic enzyme [Leuconostoc]|uniref:NADP-dependent malic enzyme n=4 Tax=Leuconostoc TaxID=1243 RepID=A0A9Q3XUA9_9LACO|nr:MULTISPECIES: NADP-dependent malic enzyme [Leuconostoc]AFS39629.1 oxaloacetate decarboxylase [Leuconostoc gelidum JB7]MBZ5944114.1 NADP-dependent malic enzyme [Leuconostoc gasicomitatum]MBZ5946176.1 NADP-dependent malic enzyme [Leuconostoc gasicomitatum]MBZ5947767.1 NADP-dependent malic enzyme [Leuconostoc gasicomitatum]MBZ5949589.1 NADP-dependent malic enzyme [Leuconostoc gasicomitatum]